MSHSLHACGCITDFDWESWRATDFYRCPRHATSGLPAVADPTDVSVPWAEGEMPDPKLYVESELYVAGAISTLPPFSTHHPAWALPIARQALHALGEWEPKDARRETDWHERDCDVAGGFPHSAGLCTPPAEEPPVPADLEGHKVFVFERAGSLWIEMVTDTQPSVRMTLELLPEEAREIAMALVRTAVRRGHQ